MAIATKPMPVVNLLNGITSAAATPPCWTAVVVVVSSSLRSLRRSVFGCGGLRGGWLGIFLGSTPPHPVLPVANKSLHIGVSKNNGTPKSSILIGFSIINHPFWGFSPYFWKHPYRDSQTKSNNPGGDDCILGPGN